MYVVEPFNNPMGANVTLEEVVVMSPVTPPDTVMLVAFRVDDFIVSLNTTVIVLLTGTFVALTPGVRLEMVGTTLSCTYVKALEHADTVPAASVALATRLFDALAPTLPESAMVNPPEPFATPAPTSPTPQTLPRKTRTVAFALVVPVTVGWRLFPGEVGLVEVRLGFKGAGAVVKFQLVAAKPLPDRS